MRFETFQQMYRYSRGEDFREPKEYKEAKPKKKKENKEEEK